ncbi:hypothetical protein V2I68_10470 [Pseudomonas viridiflava]|uniref:Uncharacterized protein n=1 Tax=Pseudomonas viridiflava TaxID=33069 RepID=A0ABU7N8N8_PSEVI|nr:hypothetical protein [Pseudomonas viridiflava]MBI6577536.1 hypothetical protein [Pseudomonas viridiflava]MBI6607822.1 hypothetical protein [Pseudomonas viridiflava]MBI6639335.1 hypothetical protein [Pseudomonas viridiflava]MBI6868481.1 hypothetical protein [Pseudomonas viridiflava]MEE3935974.1 hypothetical protein [Pseudomonas viridiflava]
MMIHVQLAKDSKTVIAVFACVQDDAEYPNQALVDDSDERYLEFKKNSGVL